MSRVVVALGGNALIRRGEEGSTAVQRHNVLAAVDALTEIESLGHELVLTHGNGPQVGYLAIQADAARDLVPPPPLDVLVAESQGQIGYLLAQGLASRLARAGRHHPIAAVLTQVVVDSADPAFAVPSKPVGPVYDEATAWTLAAEHGWMIAPDGTGWRRVVPSPVPHAIVEIDGIRALVGAHVIVIACGGGGVPVSRSTDGTVDGVEAVVDKDLAAVVLALEVDADVLLLLTDVPAVQQGWGSADPTPIRQLSLDEAAAGVADGTFAAGSMGPKVTAAAEFVRRTGRNAAIGAVEAAADVLNGRAGTTLVVRPDSPPQLRRGTSGTPGWAARQHVTRRSSRSTSSKPAC